MFKDSVFRRIVAIALAANVFVAVTAPSLQAAENSVQDQNGRIELKRGFFKGLKYQYGDKKPKSVYGFSGISFKEHFEQTLGAYPPALREAKMALPLNGIALAGSLAMLALSIRMLVTTIDKAEKVSSGQLVDDSFKVGDVVPMAVAAVVMVTSSRMGHARLKKGVAMFNARGKDIPRGRSLGGVKIGYASSSIYGDDVLVDPKSGVHLGFYLTFWPHQYAAIQTEFLFAQKGFTAQASDRYIRLNYLEMPLLLEAVPFQTPVRPSVYAGPYFALKLEATEFVGGEAIESELADFYKPFDIGMVYGGSTTLGKTNWIVDVRYTHSLSSIYEGNDDVADPYGATETETDPDIERKNKTFSISLGYAF